MRSIKYENELSNKTNYSSFCSLMLEHQVIRELQRKGVKLRWLCGTAGNYSLYSEYEIMYT